ncbi:MAG: hypothetical protein N4A74_22525 [Carboxylicivirga sp.]|jgi:hypothetical protein|nr:hypothetical protein [Carboxylicivirga sp.]
MNDAIIENFLDQALEHEQNFVSSEKELVQHLSDLGYLKPDFLADFNFDTKIASALDQFMRDIKQSSLFSEKNLINYRTLFADDHQLELLRAVTDIDEGLLLDNLPQKGDISLESRMLHYRLDLMGLFERNASLPYGDYSKMMLQQLKSYCGYISMLDTINALADIENLTRRIIKKHGRENCILVCKTALTEDQKKDFELNRIFKKQLKTDFDKKSSFYELLKDKVLRRNKKRLDLNFLEAKSNSNLNHFILRLIQVHQWKDGFYDGLLDTEMGPLMFNSIKEMAIAFNNDQEEDDIKARSVLACVGNDYVLFNALFFLEKYMIEDKKGNHQQQVIAQLNTQLQKADADTQLKFELSANHYLHEAQNHLNQENQESKNGLFKRIYYGVSGFFKNLLRIGKKLFRWLVDQVKRVATFLKNFFKSMLAHMKRALHYFIRGIRFILGKGAVVSQSNRQVLLSKFSMDMDSFHIMPSNLALPAIAKHRLKVKEDLLGLQFSLAVVSKVLKLVLNMANMVTWPLLLINLVKVFKELTIQYNQINVELNSN